ncbi:hypothetical protein [Litorilituus sediminis]|uniref:Uncharacterized protein n=1 Tax=Litorilituus sediminis TaxID=718192 RepID=A0A4P6P8X3_9GAMM|nr:hypothetical protein [Litorilituus sediminis]QBG35965.1 hypothetical protein EMK97_09695 [Litorilituus sediminis]
MNNLLAHIFIFQVNEQLRKELPCLFKNSLGFTKSKNDSLEEHLQSLSFDKAADHLRDFGYPLELCKQEFLLAKWLSISLLTVYLGTPYQSIDNVYTSLHCVNCGVVSQPLSMIIKTKGFNKFFAEKLLGSSLPLNQRKALLVSAFAVGSYNSSSVGGF